MIDSAGTMESIQESQSQLKECLTDHDFNSLPILIVCNKQDLPYARRQQEVGYHLILTAVHSSLHLHCNMHTQIVDLFELNSMLSNKPHIITGCSVEDVGPFKNSLDALVGLILASSTPSV